MNFKVNSIEKSLPYQSKRDNVYVSKEDYYTVFKTNFFTVYFDGDELLKVNQCGSNLCGICGKSNGDQFNKDIYLIQDLNRQCLLVFK